MDNNNNTQPAYQPQPRFGSALIFRKIWNTMCTASEEQEEPTERAWPILLSEEETCISCVIL